MKNVVLAVLASMMFANVASAAEFYHHHQVKYETRTHSDGSTYQWAFYDKCVKEFAGVCFDYHRTPLEKVDGEWKEK